MEQREVAILMKAIAPVIREAIIGAVKPVVERLVALENREPEKGEKGDDGLGFEDMDACVLDDDRTIELSFRRGEEEKCFTFKWPTMIYRDVFKDGSEYQQGDVVTWAGSLWHCNKATTAKPGTEDWTLAAKKGRDGKDARG